jgi:hypothetical protein
MMTNTASSNDIQLEILTAPAVKGMTVSQVGNSMFSIDMNVIVVVRFPTEMPIPVERNESSISEVDKDGTQLPTYADGTMAQAGGEALAFDDFSKEHGYSPQTREVLAEWVNLQQGGE